jgi:hypothetical protein
MNSYIPIRPTLPTFGNGSTSHTQIHISMVLLNLLPSEAAKAETEYTRRTGTSFGSILPCSKTPYLPSTFLHIRFTLIEELTWCITIRPSQTFFVSMHHKCLSRNKTLATLDKRSRALVLFKTPLFFYFLSKRIQSSFLRGPTILWNLAIVSHQCWDFCDADDFIPWSFLVSSSAFVNYFWAA